MSDALPTRDGGRAVVAEHGRWTAARLLPLAGREELRAVRVVRLRGNHLDGPGLRALLATPLFAELEELDLSDNPLGAAALADVTAALPGLERLALTGVGLEGARGAAALPRLRHLALAGNRLGDAGDLLRRLDAPLASLDVAGCELVELAAAVAPLAATLCELDVARVAGVDAALAALAGAPALRELYAETAGVTDDGVVALTGGAAPSLVVLDLSRNRVGDRGARALAAWTGAPRLAEVRLYGCPVSRDVARELAGGFISILHLGGHRPRSCVTSCSMR